jgi:Protein of unknown function (DUF2934)
VVDERDEQIRQRAYELWESEERPHGEGIRHWMQAEDEFHANELEKVASADSKPIEELPEGADADRGARYEADPENPGASSGAGNPVHR